MLQGRKDESTNDFAVFLNALRLETGDTLNPPPDVTNVSWSRFQRPNRGRVRRANTEPGYSVMTLDENNAVFDGIELHDFAVRGDNSTIQTAPARPTPARSAWTRCTTT